MSVAKSTVTRLWKNWVLKHENSVNGEWDVTSGKKINGRPVKHVPDAFVDALDQSNPTPQPGRHGRAGLTSPSLEPNTTSLGI